MSNYISGNKVKARKEHKCNYCALSIPIGEVYNHETYKGDDGLYNWNSHINCGLLASKLKWFDAYDEGLGTEDFRESVYETFQTHMSENHTKEYEDKDFSFPSFRDQLEYLIALHITNVSE